MTARTADKDSPFPARLTLAGWFTLDYVRGCSGGPNKAVSEIRKPLAAANG